MDQILWLSLVLILWQACELQRSYWTLLFDRDLQRAYWQGDGLVSETPTAVRKDDEDRREYQPPRGAA